MIYVLSMSVSSNWAAIRSIVSGLSTKELPCSALKRREFREVRLRSVATDEINFGANSIRDISDNSLTMVLILANNVDVSLVSEGFDRAHVRKFGAYYLDISRAHSAKACLQTHIERDPVVVKDHRVLLEQGCVAPAGQGRPALRPYEGVCRHAQPG